MPSFPQNGMPSHAGGRQGGRGQPRVTPGFAPDSPMMPRPAPQSSPQAAVAAMHSIFSHDSRNPNPQNSQNLNSQNQNMPNMGYAAPAPNFILPDSPVQDSYSPVPPQPQRQPMPPQMQQDGRGQNPSQPQPQNQNQNQNREHERNRAAAPLPAARFFRLEKNYGREEAFSCCFRQWQSANPQRRFLHGYGLSFTITFIAEALERDGQIIESAALKPVRAWLQKNFDHKILLAADDPACPVFQNLAQAGLCDIRIMPYIGCEAFAYFAWQNADAIARQVSRGRIRAESVSAHEQGGDMASFKADNLFPPL